MPKTKLDIPKPKPRTNLEDAIASKLAEQILDDVDIAKLGQATLKHILTGAKNRFLDWLLADSTFVPMGETYLIESEQEEAKAA
ncbi:hypothetical protein TUMEXPCC7403_25235 [Tumidithrix helvetica PCC 7403]|uniref:hypothetical protein n=1 Tax=Tumidithrix helvetica TaxID=3457545 RepID=UPI003C98F91C